MTPSDDKTVLISERNNELPGNSHEPHEGDYSAARPKRAYRGIGTMSLVAMVCMMLNNNPSARSSPYEVNNAANRAPVATALFSYSYPSNMNHPAFVYPHDRVVLDGSCSYDPDGEHVKGACTYDSLNPESNLIRRVWSMHKVPEGSSLTDSDITDRFGSYPFFFPDVAGDYVLELKVTDEDGATSTDYITVKVQDRVTIESQPATSRNYHGKGNESSGKKKNKIFNKVKGLIRRGRK